ncbi:hypothetical protein BOX15_Mlig023225g1, partial [Macrostomum lignano]
WNDANRLDRIMQSLTADYRRSFGGNEEAVESFGGALDAVRASIDEEQSPDGSGGGQTTCLVCIEDVTARQPIWSCPACFVSLHLPCTLSWIRSCSVITHAGAAANAASSSGWTCPNCRASFKAADVPKRYTCYCGRVEDPEFDPWLVPHSCGSRCDRTLNCGGDGHTCLLLCHPGRCPPCPRTVTVACHCGGGGVGKLRCGQTWSCERPCSRPLAGCEHRCPVVCHPGPCQPCSVRLNTVTCRCGSQQRPAVLCSERDWQCDRVCNRDLGCGYHRCQRVCHSDPCGSCPAAGGRTCPCGKLPLPGLSCSDDVVLSTCSDTCGRSLACGVHACPDQCHLGPCPPCREMVRKACRCGKTTREVQCHKQVTCDVKCGRDRGCGRHQCKRRCCPGGCPPCDAVCGRPLNCGQHKCQSPCHSGPCYPCTERQVITCPCGFARVAHPCGSRRRGPPRPPRCPRPCQAPPDCRHPAREPHPCHSGACPPCRLPCGAELPCGHACQSPCHAAKLVTIKREVRGPWDGPAEVQELRCLPCPPCRAPVPVRCLGGHEVANAPCCKAKPRSCGRACGAEMNCGRHRCELDCHELVTAAGSEADPRHRCERPCQQSRPQASAAAACRHPCPLTCHRGPCPPCKLSASIRCHCGASKLRRACRELANAAEDKLADLLRCPNACQRRRPGCGHPCGAPCHPGPCDSLPADCEAPVELRCPCRRIQRLVPCRKIGKDSSSVSISCDDRCRQEADLSAARRRRQAASPTDAAAAAAAEAATRQAEAALLRRLPQQQQQQRRRRKRTADEDEESGRMSLMIGLLGGLQRRWKPLTIAALAALLAAALVWAALSEEESV